MRRRGRSCGAEHSRRAHLHRGDTSTASRRSRRRSRPHPPQPRGGIQNPVRHHWRRPKVELGRRAEVVGLPAPGDAQLADVVAIDLIQRRVAGAAGIVPVVEPFDLDVTRCDDGRRLARLTRRHPFAKRMRRQGRRIVRVAERSRVGRRHRLTDKPLELPRAQAPTSAPGRRCR